MKYYNKILGIAQTVDSSINYLDRELRNLPRGKLVIRKKGSRTYYTRKWGGKETGITHKNGILIPHVRKRYSQLQLQYNFEVSHCLKLCLKELNQIEKKYDSQLIIYEESDSSCDISRQARLNPIEIAAWAASPFEGNPAYPEHLRFLSSNGIAVRSKSERIIANTLEALGIAYRYEDPLELDGTTIYPDFKIIRSDGSIIIWEHLGLVDFADYLQDNILKLQRYAENGYSFEKNIILTFEQDIRSQADVIQILLRLWY